MIKQQLMVIIVYHQLSDTSAIWQWEQAIFQLDRSEARYVLEQQALLDFHNASSPKQQSAGRHVTPLGHIILIPSQPVFALSP
jgi:hypothetical protein